MFNVYFKNEVLPGKHDFEGGKLLACMLHVNSEADVSVVDDETGEVVFWIFKKDGEWEIYEVDPEPIIAIELEIVIEIQKEGRKPLFLFYFSAARARTMRAEF